MSKNLAQIFAANPITTIGATDVMYVVTTDTTDAAISGANFLAQIAPLTTKGDLYTFSTVNARLAVGATNGMFLQVNSAAGTGLAWSTVTLPSTTTINQILYSSSANVVGGISAVNSAVMISSAGGVPSFSTTLPSGLTIPGYQTSLTLPLSLANGGTNAALTASNGGIFYSTGSAGAILSGTATANQLLLSGSSTTPAWSTSTYPATNAISTLLYASAANVMSALATANNGLLVTSSTGVPSILAGPGTTGNVLQSNAAAAPSFSTATYPSVGTATGSLLRADGTNWVATTSTYPNTNAINTLLYASSANVMSALATSTTAVLTTSSGVPTWAAQLSMALGGTNAALTASNGGIFYSTASAGAILSGTATAGLALLSGANTTPTWSTSKPITQVVVQTFAATGTYTPTAGMVYCEVEAVGGGGGSGGITGVAAGQYNGAAGGGGAYSKSIFTAAQIGASKAVAIGAAGAAGTNGPGAGGDGGSTTLGVTLLTAPGGKGSGTSPTSLGGAGGAAGTANKLALPGYPGMNASVNPTAASVVFPGSYGGNSAWGQGGQTSSTNSTSIGQVGTGYGAGASGANTYNSTSTFAGGAGTIGYMIVTEYLSV